jgi:hypothetical protein
MEFKLRQNGPVSIPDDASDVLHKLQEELCPIVASEHLKPALKEQDAALNSQLTALPIASLPYHTPKLLMAISGCGWHQTIPSLHLFKLYMGSLHVLRNTDGYVQSEQEKSLQGMEKRLFSEFCKTTAKTEEDAMEAQLDFTFKSLRLLEYQVLTIMAVDQSEWPNLLCINQVPDPAIVHKLCRTECEKGCQYLLSSRKRCVDADTQTPHMQFHLFLHDASQASSSDTSSTS